MTTEAHVSSISPFLCGRLVSPVRLAGRLLLGRLQQLALLLSGMYSGGRCSLVTRQSRSLSLSLFRATPGLPRPRAPGAAPSTEEHSHGQFFLNLHKRFQSVVSADPFCFLCLFRWKHNLA